MAENAEGQSHLQNGLDDEGNLWVDGRLARVIDRKPRTTKVGSLSNVHTRSVTGDLKEGAGIAGAVNTNHQGPSNRRSIEELYEKKGK